MSRQRSLRPRSSISSRGMPEANAPPTSDPADVPATQSIRIPFSASARRTPTWAIPRAAPPESARPIVGLSNRIQDYNLSPFPSCIQKHVRIGFYFRFHQRLLYLVSGLLEQRNDASRKTQ